MESTIQKKCDLLCENRDLIKKVTFGEMNLIRLMGALAYTMNDKKIDIQKYKDAAKTLKKNAGIFSSFRGVPKVLVVSKMAMEDDPKAYFEAVKSVYGEMMKKKVFSSNDRILASISIVDSVEEAKRQEIVEKARNLHKKMKEQHPLLTNEDDIAFATLLAMTDADTDKILEDIEASFQEMKKESFFGKDNIQRMTQVLGISGMSSQEKCEKMRAISKSLKANHRNFGKGQEYPILASLAIMNLPVETIVEQVIEADDILKHKKGFGAFGTGKRMRQLFAAAMVVLANLDIQGADQKAVIAAEGITMNIVEEIILAIIIASISIALNSASRSSSSSSN